jgi:hypothetical protein
MYTKKEARFIFSEIWRDMVTQNRSLTTDRIAKSEAWNNFTDSLCKGNTITDSQFRKWTNPF